MTEILEKFSSKYPDVEICVCSGSNEELIKELSAGKLDVIILPENVEIPIETQYEIRHIPLHHTPVTMSYGGLPIEPITEGCIEQKILWKKTAGVTLASRFTSCIQDRTAVRK